MTPLVNKLIEEMTLRGNTLWEERHFAEMLMITPLGIPLLSSVGRLMNSAGDRKTSSGMIFPWQLAEDNPVISW